MVKMLPFLMLIAMAACASAAESGRSGGYNAPLTRADLDQMDYQNAYEAVQAARPRWLRDRGTSIELENTVQVYVNGVRRGGPEELETIPLSSVSEIRFYDSREATLRFGTGHQEGVIEVIT